MKTKKDSKSAKKKPRLVARRIEITMRRSKGGAVSIEILPKYRIIGGPGYSTL